MHRFSKLLINSLLLFMIPCIALYPQGSAPQFTLQIQQVNYEEAPTENNYVPSYDEIMRLLDEIESGELETKCTPEELSRIMHFLTFLAKEGVLSDDSEESLSLDDDIEELLSGGDSSYENSFFFQDQGNYQYMVIPAILYRDGEVVLCKGWLKKQWKSVKKFAKKHKKALIIGAIVVVATVAIVVAVAASSTAAATAVTSAAGAAGAAASSSPQPSHSHAEEPSIALSSPTDMPLRMPTMHETPFLKSAMDEQIYSFKENLQQQQFFQPTNPQTLSWEENGRALGSLFAHDSLNNLQQQIPYNPWLAGDIQEINSKYSLSNYQTTATGHPEIDRKFSTDYANYYANPAQQADFNTLSYQARGESALKSGYLTQAVQDLGNAIEANPSNPIPYLERGIAHFGLGEYDRSIEDYHQFTSQVVDTPMTYPLSVPEFSLGFAKGLPKGIYESGEGILLFFADLVTHPVHTASQMIEAVTMLTHLARTDEWGAISEALAPEIHQLVTQWDMIPSDKKGELAGFALGKHGADILAPGGLAKLASKSAKGAQELAAVCKNLQITQETLLLETAAGIGNSAKIGEVVRNGQTMSFLGEELGFAAQEISQLKQTGKLGSAINSGLEKLVSQSESGAYKTAISQNKHVKMVRDYLDKPAKEIQKGVNSYEKQIALHKDKIANPAKHCPDWDKLDPRQREALVNKKWPTEIQIYEEQRSILQSILNERVSHE